MLRVLLIVVGFGLSLYALLDCIRTEDDKVRNLPKLAWIALIAFVMYLGPLAWIIAGRQRQWPGTTQQPRTLAPDDDPDFLRNLEIDLHRKHDTDET